MLLFPLVASLICVIILFVVVGFVLNKQNLPVSRADAALVFGTGLPWKARSRWLHAAQLFKNGKINYLIVSGGVLVPQQAITEAEWFRDHLVALGIPSEKIILENQATNAFENAEFALPILQKHGFRSVVLVMSDFTGLRASLTAKKAWQGNRIKIYNSHASSGSHWNPWTWWLSLEGWQLTKYVITRLFRYNLLRYLWN